MNVRRRASLTLLAAMLFLTAAEASAAGHPQRYDFEQVAMGVPVKITVYACDRTPANNAARAAFERIHAIDQMMSDYKLDSELMKLCREAAAGKPRSVSPELSFVLRESVQLSEATNGSFDVTVGPIVRLWRRARRQKKMPSEERLAEARALTGFGHLKVGSKTVTFARSGMRIDLGGIAKGYATDEALKVLKAHDMPVSMIDAGGDLRIGDAPPDRTNWSVLIAPLERDSDDSSQPATPTEPPLVLKLQNQAVATSGDKYQFVEIDNVRYSHIVDPHTGLGVTLQCSVTVVANDGTEADSLASAVTVLGPERGLKLIEATRDVECRVSWIEGGKIRSAQSTGFSSFVTNERR